MKTLFTALSLLVMCIDSFAQDSAKTSEAERIAPKSIEGLRMTFKDYVCYQTIFLFWPGGRYTSVGMALPTCHSFVEMQTEAGFYHWRVTDSRHAFLDFGPQRNKRETYKFVFDTPSKATGYLADDVRPYSFSFEKP